LDRYRFTNVGHSLGAGVAPLFTILLVKNPELIGGISPELIHSYGFAPPRVMSLDLSIKYAAYITSCVYQASACGSSFQLLTLNLGGVIYRLPFLHRLAFKYADVVIKFHAIFLSSEFEKDMLLCSFGFGRRRMTFFQGFQQSL
jgi:hypothetical protein